MNIWLEHPDHGSQNATTLQHYDFLISVGWKEVKELKKTEPVKKQGLSKQSQEIPSFMVGKE